MSLSPEDMSVLTCHPITLDHSWEIALIQNNPVGLHVAAFKPTATVTHPKAEVCRIFMLAQIKILFSIIFYFKQSKPLIYIYCNTVPTSLTKTTSKKKTSKQNWRKKADSFFKVFFLFFLHVNTFKFFVWLQKKWSLCLKPPPSKSKDFFLFLKLCVSDVALNYHWFFNNITYIARLLNYLKELKSKLIVFKRI